MYPPKPHDVEKEARKFLEEPGPEVINPEKEAIESGICPGCGSELSRMPNRYTGKTLTWCPGGECSFGVEESIAEFRTEKQAVKKAQELANRDKSNYYVSQEFDGKFSVNWDYPRNAEFITVKPEAVQGTNPGFSLQRIGSTQTVGWWKDKEEAEKEATRMNYRGGGVYKVIPN